MGDGLEGDGLEVEGGLVVEGGLEVEDGLEAVEDPGLDLEVAILDQEVEEVADLSQTLHLHLHPSPLANVIHRRLRGSSGTTTSAAFTTLRQSSGMMTWPLDQRIGLRRVKCRTPSATGFQLHVGPRVRILLLGNRTSVQQSQHGTTRTPRKVRVAVGIAPQCFGRRATLWVAARRTLGMATVLCMSAVMQNLLPTLEAKEML